MSTKKKRSRKKQKVYTIHWPVLLGLTALLVALVLLVVGVYVVMIIMLAGKDLLGRLNRIIPILDLSGSWESVRFLIRRMIHIFNGGI